MILILKPQWWSVYFLHVRTPVSTSHLYAIITSSKRMKIINERCPSTNPLAAKVMAQ